jgi:HD-like signal output (HDOD) protein
MIQVLIVEGHASALAALQQRLLPLQLRWDIHWAGSGAAALAELEARPYDTLVTDLRLPDMDGAQLLTQAQARYPDLLRYGWTGDTRRLGSLQALPAAHQILSKTCPIDLLQGVVERGHALRQRLQAPAVRHVLARLKSLPALPQFYERLCVALDNPASSSAAVADILEQDVGMTARILQMANSAFFPGARKISNVKDAVTRIGMLPLRGVVLSLDLFRSMAGNGGPPGFSLETLQQHSLEVAQRAAGMLADPDERQIAFSAGMLHDLGQLLFATGLAQPWAVVRQRAQREQRPLFELETELLGCSHAEIGGRVLALWGLPNAIVEAVTYHHRPAASGQHHFGAVAAVHVADALAHVGDTPLSARSDVHIDEHFLVRVGGMPALQPGFRAAARAAA